MIYFFVVLGLLSLIVFFYLKKRKYRFLKIDTIYESDEGRFEIKGTKREFIIKKDGKFEFLIRDGQIVAVKDKRRSQDFVNYGGAE